MHAADAWALTVASPIRLRRDGTSAGVETRTTYEAKPTEMAASKRMPRGKSRWYLVHAPGREQSTCDKLRKVVSSDLLDDAFVMRKERWRKFDGEWKCYTVPVYQDYLFVATRKAAALDKELSRLTFPVQVAKAGGRLCVPLAAEAQAWYERMADAAHVIRTSTGVIVDGELDVQRGPLMGQEAHVTKVVRHKRFCLVAIGDGNSGFRESVPLVVPFKG